MSRRVRSRPALFRRRLAGNAGEAFAAHGAGLVPDAEVEQIVERLVVEDVDDGAGHQAEVAPAAEALRLVVLHLADDDALAGGELAQGFQGALLQAALGRGDGM